MRFVISSLVTFTACLCVVCGLHGQGQETPRPAHSSSAPQSDPLEEHLFPPDLIQQNKEMLGLSAEQQGAIERLFQNLRGQLPDKESQLRREIEALGRLIPQTAIDESALLGQLDKVLDAEREIKRLHLATMFRLRKELTAEQLGRLQSIKKGMRGAEQRLHGKLQHLERLIQQRAQESGQPPIEVVERMQAFPRLMQQGNITEAEALLDESINKLEGGGR